jgi:hypothetical protein
LKKRWKIVLWILATVLVLELAVDYLLAESIPIAWHLRHGFHAELQGLRFRVPFLYYEDHGVNMLQLSFNTMPGRLNKKYAFVTVDFHKQPPTPPETAELKETRLKKFGMQQERVQQVRMAGREGICTDFAPALLDSIGQYVIDCSFGEDLHVHFNGTQNAIPDFYTIVASAESVKGKN